MIIHIEKYRGKKIRVEPYLYEPRFQVGEAPTGEQLMTGKLLRLFPVQLVVLLHGRYCVHGAEQYFGGDLDTSGLCGRPVAGTAATARRRRTVSAARTVQTLCRTVIVDVATCRPGRRTVRHPGLRRTFRYLKQ